MRFLNIIFFLWATKAFSIPAGLELSRETEGLKVWRVKAHRDVIVTLRKDKREAPLDWSRIQKSDFFQKLEQKKKKALTFVGISNWNAHKYQWEHKKNVAELTLEGSYTNSSKKEISFIEIHLYKKNEAIQILCSYPSHLKEGKQVSWGIIGQLTKKLKEKPKEEQIE